MWDRRDLLRQDLGEDRIGQTAADTARALFTRRLTRRRLLQHRETALRRAHRIAPGDRQHGGRGDGVEIGSIGLLVVEVVVTGVEIGAGIIIEIAGIEIIIEIVGVVCGVGIPVLLFFALYILCWIIFVECFILVIVIQFGRRGLFQFSGM